MKISKISNGVRAEGVTLDQFKRLKTQAEASGLQLTARVDTPVSGFGGEGSYRGVTIAYDYNPNDCALELVCKKKPILPTMGMVVRALESLVKQSLEEGS